VIDHFFCAQVTCLLQHLVETRTQQFQQVDSARANLASTYVNAFLNAGFGQDKLISNEGTLPLAHALGCSRGCDCDCDCYCYCVCLLPSSAENNWLYKNKEHGMLAATASVGMLLLWNVDEMTKIDKYMYSREDYIKAGALLGVGERFAAVCVCLFVCACMSVRCEVSGGFD
jgi:26S proteasome regulatory subunit N1